MFSLLCFQSAKSLLIEGLKWHVGNGTLIKVWEGAWVPGEGVLSRPNPLTVNDADLQVSDIIEFKNGGWDTELVNTNFPEIISQKVLEISVSLANGGTGAYF